MILVGQETGASTNPVLVTVRALEPAKMECAFVHKANQELTVL